MTQMRLHLTFPEERVREPIVYEICKTFPVVVNIRRADISEDSGWMELEMDGELADIERTVAYLRDRGVVVAPLEKSILEG